MTDVTPTVDPNLPTPVVMLKSEAAEQGTCSKAPPLETQASHQKALVFLGGSVTAEYCLSVLQRH